MRTNLIQSYLQNNQVMRQYNADNAKKNFDVNKELSNRTFIKPLPSNGHLVRNSLFDMPSEFFKDIKYDAKAFTHSLKGNANDHELGTLNDLGMKLAGLSIATYLFSRKSTPLAKVMEFVGLTTFFGAMDIWPKLALQLPAYLIHGFNIRQNYRDNYGTKKPVFLDHQFIPWDLYSDEEINKIGDRMGVPKNMKNRRDFIQEKMRKIALQNNTMWMLTAGFATPVMSALICNALEKPITKYQDKLNNKKADRLLTDFNTEAEKINFNDKTKALSALLDGAKDKNITPELFKEVSESLTDGLDSITGKAVKRDLKNILYPDRFDISNRTFENLSASVRKMFEGLTDSELDAVIPNAQEIISKLPEDKKNTLQSEVIHGQTEADFNDYVKAFTDAIEEKTSKFETDNPNNKNLGKIKFTIEKICNGGEVFDKNFKAVRTTILDESKIKSLKDVKETLNKFQARQNVLNRYAYLKVAQAPETYLANTWNQIVSDDLIKTLGITDKEIRKTRMDSNLVKNLVRNKFEAIVSDDAKYNAVMDKITEKLNFLEQRTEAISGNESYKTRIDTTFDEAKNSLKNSNMKYTVQRLVGYNSEDIHTLKSLQSAYVNDRVESVKNSFYRLLNTLDFFKRVHDTDHLDSLLGYDYKAPDGTLLKASKFTREVKEEMIGMAKELLLSGHSSDYAVKFYFLRDANQNPSFDPAKNPNAEADKARMTDFDDVAEGKYKYLEKIAKQDLADNPHDRIFYDAVMRLMYGDPLSEKTNSKITDSIFKGNFETYRKDLLKYLGGAEYFAKVNHKVNGKECDSTTEYRFNLLGSSIDDMFTKYLNTKYNSSKWFKMFGGLGAVLLGVTVISQFFMGHVNSYKVPKENKK